MVRGRFDGLQVGGLLPHDLVLGSRPSEPRSSGSSTYVLWGGAASASPSSSSSSSDSVSNRYEPTPSSSPFAAARLVDVFGLSGLLAGRWGRLGPAPLVGERVGLLLAGSEVRLRRAPPPRAWSRTPSWTRAPPRRAPPRRPRAPARRPPPQAPWSFGWGARGLGGLGPVDVLDRSEELVEVLEQVLALGPLLVLSHAQISLSSASLWATTSSIPPMCLSVSFWSSFSER